MGTLLGSSMVGILAAVSEFLFFSFPARRDDEFHNGIKLGFFKSGYIEY